MIFSCLLYQWHVEPPEVSENPLSAVKVTLRQSWAQQLLIRTQYEDETVKNHLPRHCLIPKELSSSSAVNSYREGTNTMWSEAAGLL